MSNVARVAGQAANTLSKPLNVEDVFSTYLYDGDGTNSRQITNGIDLDSEGGLVWLKMRSTANGNGLYDTERGVGKFLQSNSTGAEVSSYSGVSSFNSNGFSLDNSFGNQSSQTYASWTFRKAPKFFDVVTYTGTGSVQNISHNLGSVPACIIIKSTSHSTNWTVYHRGMDATAPEDYNMHLNTTDARADETTRFNDTAPTDTQFTVGTFSEVNEINYEFVAYLFAHNDGDGGFGPDGDADIIKCGSYSGDSTTDGSHEIDLGFEPQWVLIKQSNGSDLWFILDTMRGMTDSSGSGLYPHLNVAEDTDASAFKIQPTPTGFRFFSNSGFYNLSGEDYIYIAIRRGPMAVPTDATEVFAMDTLGGTSPNPPAWNSGFPVDMGIYRLRNSTSNFILNSRLNQGKRLMTNATDAESGESAAQFDYMNGYYDSSSVNSNYIDWMWRRAPNYFDVVAYTGNGTAGRTVSHNLGVAPEMMWVKQRSGTNGWRVYHSALGNTKVMYLDADTSAQIGSEWNNTSPTSSNFTVGSAASINGSGGTYIAYLFASLDGVSKLGSISHTNGVDTNVDCGFSSGARFVLWKQTDASNNWGIVDVERGLVSGNDALLRLDITNAETSSFDLIDPLSSGFVFKDTFGTGSYIFYAIA